MSDLSGNIPKITSMRLNRDTCMYLVLSRFSENHIKCEVCIWSSFVLQIIYNDTIAHIYID